MFGQTVGVTARKMIECEAEETSCDESVIYLSSYSNFCLVVCVCCTDVPLSVDYSQVVP